MKVDEPAIGICVVTFRRPELLLQMLLQIKKRTLYKNYKIYIIIDHEEDRVTLKALKESEIIGGLSDEKIEMFPSQVECVKATNRCYSIGEEPYFVYLSDDMEVEIGWLREAMKCMQVSLTGEGLVLFQDGVQNGRNACAGLISRNYIKAELGGIFYNEIYKHFRADTELFRKSKAIDRVKYCPTSIVWHRHWSAPGKHRSEKDVIYAQSDHWRKRDKAIFAERAREGFK